MKKITAVDLFCGAGGTSTGLVRACEEAGWRHDLTAINHWSRAIETHSANHSSARHLCQTLDAVDPHKVITGKLDLLVASPECTHHSTARGGKPCNDQSRASAWHVVRWIEACRPRFVLVENVREFQTWGPLGATGRPLPSRRGDTFKAWVDAITSLGYRVTHGLLNAADFGDPTTRLRLFVLAARGSKNPAWPSPTHSREGNLFAGSKWRSAREVIDWKLKGQSIFSRKRPLSDNTLRRIRAGLERFGGKPFLVPNFGERDGQKPRCHDVDAPTPTVTGHGAGGLIQPFLLGQQSGGAPRATGEPVPTVTADGAISLIQPFLMREMHQETDRVHSVEAPVPTVMGANRGEMGLVEPFVVTIREGEERRIRSIDEPLPTVTASAKVHGICQPFLVSYYGNGGPQSLDEPIDTVTARDRFGLVEIDGMRLDVLFRMLQPHELAAAQGFPPDYKFAGTRADQIRQIGNAVPVNTAYNLCRALLAG